MRQRGEHEKPGIIKKSILSYLINYKNGIDEPTLRDYIKANERISENKTIKKHLDDLLKDNCLFKTENRGKANHWIINDIEHLQNIYKKYPEMLQLLIDSPLSFDLILPLCFFKPKSEDKILLRSGLRVPSFYKLVLNNNIEDFYKRASMVHLLNGPKENIEIRKEHNISRKTYYMIKDSNIIEEIIDICCCIDILNGTLPSDLFEEIEKHIQAPFEKNSGHFEYNSFDKISLHILKSDYLEHKFNIPIITDYINTKRLEKLLNNSIKKNDINESII